MNRHNALSNPVQMARHKVRKSAFKNTDTYKDRNVETEQVWLD